MGDNYVLLIIGIIFLSAVLWEIRKIKLKLLKWKKAGRKGNKAV